MTQTAVDLTSTENRNTHNHKPNPKLQWEGEWSKMHYSCILPLSQKMTYPNFWPVAVLLHDHCTLSLHGSSKPSLVVNSSLTSGTFLRASNRLRLRLASKSPPSTLDTVNHNILQSILLDMGISGKAHSWFKCYPSGYQGIKAGLNVSSPSAAQWCPPRLRTGALLFKMFFGLEHSRSWFLLSLLCLCQESGHTWHKQWLSLAS